ncbi:MAG TPA: GspMb/PilO family protein [Pyrinomonadaceae bacterium]|nr:GspMb/PilO family protein [Pyrinomonadaceae bacterium]
MSQASDRLTVTRRERFRKIRGFHHRNLGVAEIIGLGIAALMLLAVIVGYLYFQVPAQSQVVALARTRDHMQQQLRSAEEEFKRGKDVKVRVDEISVSIENFENHRLVDRDGGRMALYEDLNQLIRRNGLRNTSGPAYTALEPLGLKTQGQPAAAAAGSAANRWQSIYPGIGVNVTVEGQYQNIRHFVRDIESSKEFIIINAVELERATESNSQLAVGAGAPKSGSGNALVSLRLDLATYFSRPVSASEQAAVGTARVH